MLSHSHLLKRTYLMILIGVVIIGIGALFFAQAAFASNEAAPSNVIEQVTDNGVTVSISDVIFDQDQTLFVACFDLPSKVSWLPYAKLVDGASTIVNSKYTIVNWRDPKTFEGTHRCYQYTFFGKASPSAHFVIEKLQTDLSESLTQADCDRALAKIQVSHADFSFSCNFGDHGFGFDVQKPAGMTSDEASTLITDAFTETVIGPWDLPLSQ